MRLVSSAGEPTLTRAKIAGEAFATVLVLLALAAGYRALNQDVHPAAASAASWPAARFPLATRTFED